MSFRSLERENPGLEKNDRLFSPIPLPDYLQKFADHYPEGRQLLAEMVHYDRVTFLHSLMVSQAYTFFYQDYLTKITVYTPPGKLKELEAFFSFFRNAVFFHDFGKWLIDRDVEKAAEIINSTPPNGVNGNNHHRIDHRSDIEILLHKLHPLTGGYGLTVSPEIIHPMPVITGDIAKLIPFGLHEKSNGSTYDKRQSYPRRYSRITDPNLLLVMLFAQLSDTFVSMGQPRVYRPTRDSSERILNTLTGFINDNTLINIFGRQPPGNLILLRGSLIDSAFSSLRSIQFLYSEKICLNPSVFTLSDIPLEKNTDYLQVIAERTWDKYEMRFLREIEKKSENNH